MLSKLLPELIVMVVIGGFLLLVLVERFVWVLVHWFPLPRCIFYVDWKGEKGDIKFDPN